jgi:SAM-dependent methyltransferase
VTLRAFIYRHRIVGKRVIAWASRTLPAPAARRLRALAERAAFSLTPQYQGDTLPPIFHYWAARYLSPEAARLGIHSPESFYFEQILKAARSGASPVRVLSLGTGTASMEIGVAAQLRDASVPFEMTCMDFNPALMRSATESARARGLGESIRFQTLDCNQPFEHIPQDVIIVNQFFHHVTELETFCRSLRASLAADGVLLSSDIIGRNGHQLWPDVETEVQAIWATLTPGQQFDRHFQGRLVRYRPIDHAAYSNEGVRAQDVVACLLAEFDFELFFTFGGAIVPFIERRIGFNFSPDGEADRSLIDRAQAIDAEAIAAGRYPTANMIAALRHKGRVAEPSHSPLSPKRHVELTRQQQAKLGAR